MYPVTSNLISASAGTGKTYRLTSRFISLLALGYPAEKLIALTFTRNAAGEFEGRILTELAKASASEQVAKELTDRIHDTLRGGNAPLCPQAELVDYNCDFFRKKLRELIEKRSRLHLSTMDSFFNKLVSAHCYELGYSGIEQMTDEEKQKAFRKTLLTMLDEEGENAETLTGLLHDLLGYNDKDPLSALEKHINQFYQLYKNAPREELWGRLPLSTISDDALIASLQKELEEQESLTPQRREERLLFYLGKAQEKIQHLLAVINEKGIELDKRYFCPQCSEFSSMLKEREYKLKTVLGGFLYGSRDPRKKTYQNDSSADAEINELRQLMQEMRLKAILLPAAFKTKSLFHFMQRFDALYEAEVRAAGKLIFSDITRAMPDLLDPTKTENVAYRMDGSLSHWMLDEFQDTSPAQWAALKPLLENIRDEVALDDEHQQAEKSLFVVGDEKQSIYGWRGATPELFTYLATDSDWRRALRVSPQNESQRSSAVIMGPEEERDGVRYGFVNELFRRLGETHRTLLCAPLETGQNNESHHNILSSFCEHRASARVKDLSGYVRIESCAPEDGDKDIRERMCRRMVEILGPEGINFAAGGLSAAILVRSKYDVLAFSNWFAKNHPEIPLMPVSDVPVSKASFLGELFLHFFKWMNHAGDVYSCNMLKASPLQVLKDGNSEADEWQRLRQWIDDHGFVSTLQELIKGLDGAENDRAFREWCTAAQGFDVAGRSLEDWLLYIDNLEVSITPPKSYVHISTMHKSKGMEYDVVILPYPGEKTLLLKNRISYYEQARVSDGIRRTNGILLPLGTSDEDYADSPFYRLYREWAGKTIVEAFNLLYVSVTRAKRANYILLNGKADKNSYSKLILESFEPSTTITEWGNPNWYGERVTGGTKQEEAIPQLLAPHSRRRRISPSELNAEACGNDEKAATGSPTYYADNGAAAELGTAVHACFEQVDTLPKGTQDIPKVNCDNTKARRIFENAMAQPEIRALFELSDDRQAALNEQPIDGIIKRNGNNSGSWLSGIIDRLILTLDEKKKEPIAAAIIDYKTDSKDTPDDVMRKHYRPQMVIYRELVSRAYGLTDPAAVTVTLVVCPTAGTARPHLVTYSETDWA